MQGALKMFGGIQQAFPGVDLAPKAPAVTVAALLDVVDALGPADNGAIKSADETAGKVAAAMMG